MAELDDVVRELQEIKLCLQKDREGIWRLLQLTVGGAFLLIGVRLFLP